MECQAQPFLLGHVLLLVTLGRPHGPLCETFTGSLLFLCLLPQALGLPGPTAPSSQAVCHFPQTLRLTQWALPWICSMPPLGRSSCLLVLSMGLTSQVSLHGSPLLLLSSVTATHGDTAVSPRAAVVFTFCAGVIL